MLSRTTLLFGLLVFLTACSSGGGGGGSQTSNGVFIDSAVEGLRFETATKSGFTNSSGTFSYSSGETVSFYVGDILLGSAIGKAQITPIDLVTGAIDQTNPTVVNILRFIQTLDDDNDPSNGINITTGVFNLAAGMSVNFAQSVADFENDGNVQTIVATLTSALGSARTLIDAAAAQANLLASLNSGGGGGNTGNGTFGTLTVSGSDTGITGTSFTPDYGIPSVVNTEVVGVVWTGSTGVGTASVQVSSLTVTFTGTTPTSVTMIHGLSSGVNYTYQNTCYQIQGGCADVTVNQAAKTVSFNNAAIDNAVAIPNNNATAGIVINGTLSWQ